MAPSKRTPPQKQGGKHQETPASQRSISSFFVRKETNASPEVPLKTELNIPIHKGPPPDAPEAIKNTSTPIARYGAAAVPTPSPNEVSSGRHSAWFNKSSGKDGVKSQGAKVGALKVSPVQAKDMEDYPESLVGRQLKVYWPKDEEWYKGQIRSYSTKTKKHLVVYEDGEKEDLHLKDEKIKWLGQTTSSEPPIMKRMEARNSPVVLKSRASPRLSRGGQTPNKPDMKLGAEITEEDEDELPIMRPKRANRRVLYTVESDSEVDDGDEDWAAGGEAKANFTMASDDDDEEGMDLDVEEDEDGDDDFGEWRGAKRTKSGSSKITKPPKRKRASAAAAASPQQLKKAATTQNMSMASDAMTTLPPPLTKAGVPATPGPHTVPPQKKTAAAPVWKTSIKSPYAGLPPAHASGIEEKAIHAGAGLEFDLTGEAAERFGSRVAEKFQFLIKDRRDAKRRRPSDPGYDPTTLYLPESFLKGLSGGQRQWWEIKGQHMDKVLLFKMGKFYEMFEMDSHVGARDLDLQYMKGEQPHCGFPEKNYSENAERLARKGHRVLVVEQTETPEQLEIRKRETGVKDKVVKREICAVITKGTLRDGDMLAASPEAAYLLSIIEQEAPGAATQDGEVLTGSALIGVCVADTATSRFMVGQFVDDIGRGRLRAVLSELRPVELVKPRGCLSDLTEAALRDHTRQPLVNALPTDDFWTQDKALRELAAYFTNMPNRDSDPVSTGAGESTMAGLASWPRALQQLAQSSEMASAALSALGGCLSYLRSAMMDKELVSCRRFELLPGSDILGCKVQPDLEMPASVENTEAEEEVYMLLDSAALENLEILENSKDGGTAGTLLAQLDHCVTPFGRRLLRQWIVRPLYRVKAITARQHAVADLKGSAMEAFGKARHLLSGISDLERLLSRLYSNCGGGGGNGRNAENVVMYEDAARKRMKEFLDALRGCRTLLQAVTAFRPCLGLLSSKTLKGLVTPGERFPDIADTIRSFEIAFDWAEAEKSGRVIPTPGVDEAFDKAAAVVGAVEAELQAHLESVRKKLNCSEICYVNISKDPYQIEIPDRFHTKLPSDFELKTSRKGYNRYYTSKVKDLLTQLAEATETKESSHKGILRGLMVKFCASCHLWNAATSAIAELDALGSLALASSYAEGTMCRPSFEGAGAPSIFGDGVLMEAGTTGGATEWLHAKNLRHPGLIGHLASSGTFVPNDTMLGGPGRAPFMLLTGPNMGGKSTLLRQICLAVIMAQVGADVSAEEFHLSPVDRVFVRMGARDQIMASQSTFLIELSETATMLRSATRHSLVALDELGRGTATSDGQAIAYAVLQHLAHITRCRGLFSTHYHRLADEHEHDPEVALHHMACQVGPGPSGIEEVTFLYKLAEGACPKSYGINVARLSGMPESVMTRAMARAAELEVIEGERHRIRQQNVPPDHDMAYTTEVEGHAQVPLSVPTGPEPEGAENSKPAALDPKAMDILKRLEALGMAREGEVDADRMSTLLELWNLAKSQN